jgi:CBS domain-containing protein
MAMTIARIIRSESQIISCKAQTPVREAIALLAEKRIGALPVVDDGVVIGIFSERDVIYQLQSHGPSFLDKTVGDVMTSPVISIAPDTSILEALGMMTQRRFRHLPVVEQGKIIAFVSIGDLVKHRIDHISSEAEALRSYIQMA